MQRHCAEQAFSSVTTWCHPCKCCCEDGLGTQLPLRPIRAPVDGTPSWGPARVHAWPQGIPPTVLEPQALTSKWRSPSPYDPSGDLSSSGSLGVRAIHTSYADNWLGRHVIHTDSIPGSLRALVLVITQGALFSLDVNLGRREKLQKLPVSTKQLPWRKFPREGEKVSPGVFKFLEQVIASTYLALSLSLM